MKQLDFLIVLIQFFVMAYLVGLLSAWVLKVCAMRGLPEKYNKWKVKHYFPIPKYFCEWCFCFWMGVILTIVFCSVYGHWYLIVTPLFSTTIALSKYK